MAKIKRVITAQEREQVKQKQLARGKDDLRETEKNKLSGRHKRSSSIVGKRTRIGRVTPGRVYFLGVIEYGEQRRDTADRE